MELTVCFIQRINHEEVVFCQETESLAQKQESKTPTKVKNKKASQKRKKADIIKLIGRL